MNKIKWRITKTAEECAHGINVPSPFMGSSDPDLATTSSVLLINLLFTVQ